MTKDAKQTTKKGPEAEQEIPQAGGSYTMDESTCKLIKNEPPAEEPAAD